MRAARLRLAPRVLTCTLAWVLVPLLLPLAEASAALVAPAPRACVVVMHCCTTGFCPLQKASHHRPAGPAWDSCDDHVPARATTASARPPATLEVAAALTPPAGSTPVCVPGPRPATTDPPLPELPPPDAT